MSNTECWTSFLIFYKKIVPQARDALAGLTAGKLTNEDELA
jgi:hypothetical protein